MSSSTASPLSLSGSKRVFSPDGASGDDDHDDHDEKEEEEDEEEEEVASDDKSPPRVVAGNGECDVVNDSEGGCEVDIPKNGQAYPAWKKAYVYKLYLQLWSQAGDGVVVSIRQLARAAKVSATFAKKVVNEVRREGRIVEPSQLRKRGRQKQGIGPGCMTLSKADQDVLVQLREEDPDRTWRSYKEELFRRNGTDVSHSTIISWFNYAHGINGKSSAPQPIPPRELFLGMEAVRYDPFTRQFTLDKIPVPSDLAPNEVLIRVKAAALCHTMELDCHLTTKATKTETLGHQSAGIIVLCGAEVPESRIGERVLVFYPVGCGTCRWCQQGNQTLCSSSSAADYIGFGRPGGLAAYVKVPAPNALPIWDVEFTQAAPIACGLATAVHAVHVAHPSLTTTITPWAVVIGGHGVGFGLLQLLKHIFQAKVMCVEASPEKVTYAKELGADCAVDGTCPTLTPTVVVEHVRTWTGGDGADIIFDCSETTMGGWWPVHALGRRGTLVVVGRHPQQRNQFLCQCSSLEYEQQIMKSVGATIDNVQEAIQLVANGHISILVDSTVPLSDVSQGLERLQKESCVGHVVCIPNA